MKEYIRQFYNEGFAYIFCKKPINYIKKHVKNTRVSKILILLIQILFTIIVLAFAAYILYKKWPF